MATHDADQDAECGCRVRVRLANYEGKYALAWPWLNQITITEACNEHGGST